MLKKNINLIELGGRASTFMGGQYMVARVKVYYVTLGMLAMSVLYYLLLFTSIFSLIFILTEFFLVFSIAQASFINEPLWINLSIMSPLEFVRRYFASKIFSLYLAFYLYQ